MTELSVVRQASAPPGVPSAAGVMRRQEATEPDHHHHPPGLRSLEPTSGGQEAEPAWALHRCRPWDPGSTGYVVDWQLPADAIHGSQV